MLFFLLLSDKAQMLFFLLFSDKAPILFFLLFQDKAPMLFFLLFSDKAPMLFFFLFSDKAPSEATFRGSEYLSYDLSRTRAEPIVGAQDSISLNFKTRQPNGLLFYTGKAQWDST